MKRFIASTPAAEAAAVLRDSSDLDLPDDWWNWPNAVEAHQLLSRDFLAGVSEYPDGRFAGRGVVICAGGHRLFTNGWVCLRMLRHLGCRLPVEFWHFAGELDSYMAHLVKPFDVQCIDANEVAAQLARPPRILAGWELKPFAVLHSRFQEVLLLDADNVAVVNPEFLFDTAEYRELGAIFWPDYARMEPTRGMWAAAEVPYRDEPEIESGQIVLDKSRCWRAINLTMHYNEHSDFYYKHIHGDKCTFQFAWPRTGTPYAMPGRGIHSLDATMCQHDFEGRRIFQHRNMDKWQLDGGNRRIHDFQHEDLCRSFLQELAARWCGEPFRESDPGQDAARWSEKLARGAHVYHRVGHDRRRMAFLPDGTIGEGAAECERYWAIQFQSGRARLTIRGEEGVTCHLYLETDGAFRGRWLHHEKMPIELTAYPAGADRQDSGAVNP